ncbi:MAG: hypothetical protein ABIL62_16300 [Planctomycetota bacterium]
MRANSSLPAPPGFLAKAKTGGCAGTGDFKEEEKMKGVSFFVSPLSRGQVYPCGSRGKVNLVQCSGLLRRVVLAIVLFVFVFLPCGCRSYEQPGETAAEGRRRHQRALRINQQQMMADLDTLLLLDKPSKLTDKRIP